MLSLYKSTNAIRIAAIKSKTQFLNGLSIYIVRQIRGKIFQDDLQGVLATYLFVNEKEKDEKAYDKCLAKAQKLKVTLKDLKELKEMVFNDDDSFMLLPHDESIDRDTLFISGTAGCGKTYFTDVYLRYYLRFYPEKTIYYISVHDLRYDPSISKEVKSKINYLNPSNLTSILKASEKYKDSIFVFDDVDSSINDEEEENEEEDSDFSDDEEDSKVKVKTNADIKKELDKMTLFTKKAKLSEGIVRNSAINLISNGRKYGISVIFISHKLKEINTNKISLGSDTYVLFPEADGSQVVSFLTSRTNIERKTILDMVKSDVDYEYDALVINKKLKFFTYQNKIGIFKDKKEKGGKL